MKNHLNDKDPITPQYNRIMTFGVFGLVCALFYYVQKDVTRQVDTIQAQAAETKLAQQKKADPNEEVEIICPRSKYESANFYFSQYYEDYILDYVFSDVPKGIYIDVGAADPKRLSVTYSFYEKGWRGINIDPVPSYAKMYEKERPEDLFLNIGISNEAGSLSFYECGTGCGLSTFDKSGAEQVTKDRGIQFTEVKLPVITMKTVLTEHPQKEVHFVNVDVEGWERQVLEGFDFNIVKPEVFIIESTLPNTTTPTQHLWEGHLFQNGYVLAMTDFLNRYYINKQSKYLKKYLRRFSYIDMCVRQSKLRRGVFPTSPWERFSPPPVAKPAQ